MKYRYGVKFVNFTITGVRQDLIGNPVQFGSGPAAVTSMFPRTLETPLLAKTPLFDFFEREGGREPDETRRPAFDESVKPNVEGGVLLTI
jgi:hypothetical protein